MAEELDLITRFEEFLKTYKTEEGDTPYNDAIARLSLEEAISVPIDFNHLVTFDPDLASATRSHPQQAIDAASAAIRRILQVVDPDYYQTIEKPHARFKEIPDRVSVRLIRAEHIGQLIMVDALVTRVSDVKPLLVEGVFQCRQCQEIIYVQQTHQFVPPPLCTNEACRSKGPFDLIPERSKFVDWQKIRLQEKPEELPPGALPRALDCILQEDLVDIARPGDPCRIVGILRSTQDTTARTRRKAPTFTSFLATNYVAVSEREADRVEITPKEEETIHDLAQDPLIHRKLVNSIAPSIYGLTDEKEAVSLLLFGGVPKTLADGVKIRGDSNILLVGDPGTAKSQLLKYVAQIAPRGLYTSGKGSTAAGLTAAVLRDPDTEGFALEAGALVLADRGTACLHPSSRVLADNKLSTIEALFSQTTPATAVSNGETVMVGRLDVKVPSLTKDLDMIECKSTYIRKKAGPSSLLKISTETGFSTIVTPDHMLLDGASLEWKKAQDFTKGESLVAPLKVPGYNDPVYIFDLIPADWIVCLNQDEKTELRTELFKHFSSLASINRFFGLRRDVLSGRSQMKVGTLHRILSHLGIFNEWRKRKLSFGRKQSGERLKVSEITPELAYFLGFVYGDGWDRINKRRSSLSVHQSWVNQEQIHRLIECYSTFSRRSLRNYPRTCESEIRGSEVLCQSTIFTANSNLLAQIYNYLLANDLSNLLQLPNDSLAAFIGGIIDSDGCISIKCDRRSDSDYYTAHIDIQCSNNWIENQSLLLSLRRFDCYGRLKPGRGVIHVQITARVDVEALLHAIKPYSVKIKLLPKSIRTISSLSDRLPSKPIAQLAEQISTINTAMLVEKGLWSTIYSYKHERYAPSRGQVKKIQTMLDDHLSPAQHELIDNLLKRDYFLDPISSIEEIPYDGPVYDLHVPQTHNFTADGLITHNCIDEFDKMRPQDRTAIHETMEQHTVSIAKAGIVATLNARTAILAAANPNLGRYVPERSFAENVNLPVTLLSRFDLIFTLTDLPESERDERTADHILALHKRREASKEPPIPAELLRKYIAYARRNVSPVLTDEALNVVKEFYLSMRKSGERENAPVPITARQLESMIRLAEAHAKMALREKVVAEDAQAAVRLVQVSLQQVGFDRETGQYDVDNIMIGRSKSQRERLQSILVLLRDLEKESPGGVSVDKLIERAGLEGISEQFVRQAVNQLRDKDGLIYEPRPGLLKYIKGA